MSNIMVVSDTTDNAYVIIDCLRDEILNDVQNVGVLKPKEGIDEINGINVVDLSKDEMTGADYYIIYGEEFEDIRGEGVFNISFYDNCWEMSDCERYGIVQRFLREKGQGSVETLFLGMSYLQRGINRDRLKSTSVSLAAPTQDHFYDYMMYKWAMEEGLSPKRCVVEMTPYKLWYDLSLSKNKNRASTYVPQTGSVHHLESRTDVVGYYNDMYREYCDLFKKDVVQALYLNKNENESNEVDLLIWAKDPTRQSENVIEEIHKLFNKPYEDTFSENIGIIADWMIDLETREIDGVILLPPFSQIFLENMNRDMYQRTLGVVDALTRKHQNLSVINLTEANEFNDYYFSDWSHLNYFGANLMTDMLNNVFDEEG